MPAVKQMEFVKIVEHIILVELATRIELVEIVELATCTEIVETRTEIVEIVVHSKSWNLQLVQKSCKSWFTVAGEIITCMNMNQQVNKYLYLVTQCTSQYQYRRNNLALLEGLLPRAPKCKGLHSCRELH